MIKLNIWISESGLSSHLPPTAEQLVKDSEQTNTNSLQPSSNDVQVCLTPGCVKAGISNWMVI